MSPRLSVILCSLNGAPGVARCLDALDRQTIRGQLEVIVVDDGSSDDTSEVAQTAGVVLIRHSRNLGVSAARNSGIRVASADVVAFLDDDCEPCDDWAETLLAGYDDSTLAIGGALLPVAGKGVLFGYLTRHNPLNPLEMDLLRSNSVWYRFYIYMARQWRNSPSRGRRGVASLASANMSVRRLALASVGGFDERIRFGSEDEDLCRRLAFAYPGQRLTFDPAARVHHHFTGTLRDMVRRRRAYGRGSALMYHKWPDVGPTWFPFPVVVLGLLCMSVRFPVLAAVAVAAPQVFYPMGLRLAIGERRLSCVLDAYLQLVEEASDDVGFLEGLWRFRDFRHRQQTLLGLARRRRE